MFPSIFDDLFVFILIENMPTQRCMCSHWNRDKDKSPKEFLISVIDIKDFLYIKKLNDITYFLF